MVDFPESTEDFVAETGLGFSYIVALFEDVSGNTPDAADAAAYWGVVDEPELPITVDPEAQQFDATPFDGSPLPGKCVLSPDMVMLDCRSGEETDGWAFDVIREHAGI